MKKQYSVKRVLAGLGCCTAMSGAVWAQLAQPSPELQEIVVTAEKRESTVQKTPISITAISGSDLQAQGISSLCPLPNRFPAYPSRPPVPVRPNSSCAA